jgi:hypothetical protein
MIRNAQNLRRFVRRELVEDVGRGLEGAVDVPQHNLRNQAAAERQGVASRT